ncbi:MAG: hypothetical protein J5I53_03485 [Bradyrhizobiaceae bacterium]|nr:hypothetical protein [Bradyrhizobiaceae bacterium]
MEIERLGTFKGFTNNLLLAKIPCRRLLMLLALGNDDMTFAHGEGHALPATNVVLTVL